MKEAEGTPNEEIEAAEAKVLELQEKKVEASEIALIRNLHWWTVEYLGWDSQNPKIYGAGLLSSIGESEWCMKEEVKKKNPLQHRCGLPRFRYYKPQPQLYVTPDFAFLQEVLEEFANTMAVRKGGWRGLQKLIGSKTNWHHRTKYRFANKRVFTHDPKRRQQKWSILKPKVQQRWPIVKKEIIGHGTQRHSKGFRSPLGQLKKINLAIENMGPRDLQAYNFYDSKPIAFEFESGITVEG